MKKNVPPIFAYFTNLRDVPGARLPSGMGSQSNNSFSTLTCSFYLKAGLQERDAERNAAVQQGRSQYANNLLSGLGDDDAVNYAKSFVPIGGRRTRRKRLSKRRKTKRKYRRVRK